MAEVFVGLGSNIDARYHLRIGLKSLAECFGELSLSPVYESEPVGFAGANFLNLVAHFQTELAIRDVLAIFQRIEYAHGRRAEQPRFSSRTLDLDLLTYDDWVGNSRALRCRARRFCTMPSCSGRWRSWPVTAVIRKPARVTPSTGPSTTRPGSGCGVWTVSEPGTRLHMQ
jgi:2-amino-4-hydroxy-6-hydroxymethyldihydropteridine diphosphokinase